MNNKPLNDLLDSLTAESEVTKDDPMPTPLPAGTKVYRRQRRERTLQVRLSEEELAELEDLARRREMPLSTVARTILLTSARPQVSISDALDKIESDVQALRSLSAA